MRSPNRRGFTLIELVVTILIIGVLSSYAVPQYLKTVETGKADDAVAITNMIGTTNKMYALDHSGSYISGNFAAACGCVATTCTGYAPPAAPTTFATACALVCCNYLADQDWANKAYQFYACDPLSGGGGGACVAGMVAASKRQATAYSPYNTWTYTMSQTGAITASGTNPPPPTY